MNDAKHQSGEKAPVLSLQSIAADLPALQTQGIVSQPLHVVVGAATLFGEPSEAGDCALMAIILMVMLQQSQH